MFHASAIRADMQPSGCNPPRLTAGPIRPGSTSLASRLAPFSSDVGPGLDDAWNGQGGSLGFYLRKSLRMGPLRFVVPLGSGPFYARAGPGRYQNLSLARFDYHD